MYGSFLLSNTGQPSRRRRTGNRSLGFIVSGRGFGGNGDCPQGGKWIKEQEDQWGPAPPTSLSSVPACTGAAGS